MSSNTELLDIYVKIQSKAISERANGLSELKRFLNSNNTKDINDKGYLKMYEAILYTVMVEKTIYAKQKTGVPKRTIGSTYNRLGLCGLVFRSAIELGVKHIRNKTFKTVYKRIIDIIPPADAELCEPMISDFFWALRLCLEHPPHTEHLLDDEWEALAKFCCAHIDSQLGILDEKKYACIEAGRSASLPRDTSNASSRSSMVSTSFKRDREEMMNCLNLLLGSPKASLVRHVQMPCNTLLRFLISQSSQTNSHAAAFSALNSILDTIITNDIAFASRIAEAIIPVIIGLWPLKLSLLKDHMLISLVLLEPHIRARLRDSGSINLRSSVESLFETILRDHDQLQMDDIAFPAPLEPIDTEVYPLALKAFCLRKGTPPRTEQAWIVLQLMAKMANMLDQPLKDVSDVIANDLGEEFGAKRRRLSGSFDEVMRNARSTNVSTKLCALQILPFLFEDRNGRILDFSSTLSDLYNASSDDNPNVSSWSMLSIARWV
ncbi:Serine/threonine-protein kinase tel1 [Rhizina undulata]